MLRPDLAAAWESRLGSALPPEAHALLAGLDVPAAQVLLDAFVPPARPVTRDRLTGMLTRPVFEEALAHEVASASRHGAPSLLVADLDGLTAWTEAQGHLAADLLVVRLAEILTRSSRRSDVMGRLGVDQLAVLLPRTEAARGLVVARRVLARALADVRQAERTRPGSTVAHPSLSIGLGHLPEPGNFNELLQATESALLRARQAGGGVIECTRPEDLALSA